MSTDPDPSTTHDADHPHQSTVLETRLTVPVGEVEIASDRLWQAGAQAIEEVALEEIAVDGVAGTADAPVPMIELRTVLAATEDDSRASLGAVPPGWVLSFARRPLAAAQTWRAFAKPVVISPRLIIVPAWQAELERETGDPAARTNDLTEVLIEPGAAFGLGDHPTTRLMLEALDAIDSSGPNPGEHSLRGQRVLDVGTGTGVLATVAAIWGATVTAVDIAPAAVEATEHNAATNGVVVDVSTTPIEHCRGIYDVVLANILAPTLIAMAADLRRLTAPAGTLVVSGILADSHDHVLAALGPLEPVASLERDGWAAVTLVWPERPPATDR